METTDNILSSRKEQLDKLRPVSGKGLAVLSSWYDVELTFTSNALEGNTLNRGETALVLEKGITIGGKPLKDHLEAVGHKEALDYVRDVARQDRPVREGDVRQIHKLVVGLADRRDAGRYADRQRLISGTSYVPPTPAEIPPRMGDFGQWLAGAPTTADTAIDAHERLVTIHPFNDGNGRTARLLMNLVLLKGGYPPIVVAPEQRAAYNDTLQRVQVRGDKRPHRQFMTDRLAESLDHHLTILRRGLEQVPNGGH